MTDPSQSPGPEFGALTALICLLADPKATAKRLDELQRRIDAATKAETKFATERAAYEARVATTTAEIAAREAKVADRLYRAMRLEANPPADRDESDRPDPFPHDPNFLPGTRSHTGLARHKGDRRADDGHLAGHLASAEHFPQPSGMGSLWYQGRPPPC
jgi:hypothetical protein